MEARVNFFILICLAGLVSIGFSQEAATSPESASAGDANEVTAPSFPYVARITGDDVYVRSGQGRNHYPCGKLSKGDRVTVVDSQFGWSRIVPPAGSYSWISMQYVSVDPDRPEVGTVTGNAVRVYVGSDYRDVIRSTQTQLKLNKDEKVSLLGERKSGYHKIAPPTGAYRWVSTQYTEPLTSAAVTSPVIGPLPAPSPVPADANTAAVSTVDISVAADRLAEYYALEKRMKAERAKPISEQDYADIKKSLLEIVADKGAGKAARYADFAIKHIERFELALKVVEAVRLQDAQLQQIKEGIAEARAKRLAEVQDRGAFAVVGRFQTSSIYGPKPGLEHYRIIDDSGRILCYALPVSKADYSKFVGRKVGLVGTIERHLQTAGALVRFTAVVELK